MPSIHPDYEYDIFISYRQNDNRSDKWVSNFVEALKEELEATLKNPISIYFDENPHDGLLQTHQVDASLAKKLKCLVFMPIISQTYCDETSFAWENEFMPFIKMAKEDKLGMNITLSNGNVVSRVLPVKIHRLDIDDQNTLEAVLDGPLRSIDFIYQEAGVNRPLKPDDDRNLNLDKTDYQNQINKVANALKDIGLSIIKKSDVEITVPIPERERPVEVAKSSKIGIYIGLAIIIIALLAFWGYKQFYNSPVAEVEVITIAVLAFDDQSPNGDQEWLGDGMADEILFLLSNFEGIQVVGKTSSFSFKGKGLTTKEIGKLLNVNAVLEGSVSKIDNKLRITAQLINTRRDTNMWSQKYDRDATDIFAIIDEVALSIAQTLISELDALISELDASEFTKSRIVREREINFYAYENYLKGEYWNINKFTFNRNDYSFIQAERMYIYAISIDPMFLDAFAGLAYLYDRNGNYLKRDSIIRLAGNSFSSSAYLTMANGLHFRDQDNIDLDSAFHYFWIAHEQEPDNPRFNNLILKHLITIGLYKETITLCNRLLVNDPLNHYYLFLLAASYSDLGEIDLAKEQVQKMLEIDPLNPYALSQLLTIALMYDKNISEAQKNYNLLMNLDNDFELSYYKALILALEGKQNDALLIGQGFEVLTLLGMKKESIARFDTINSPARINHIDDWSYVSLKTLPQYDSIRSYPNFQSEIAKAKKVHEERVAKYGHLFDE